MTDAPPEALYCGDCALHVPYIGREIVPRDGICRGCSKIGLMWSLWLPANADEASLAKAEGSE